MSTGDLHHEASPTTVGFREDIAAAEAECRSFIRSFVEDAGIDEAVVALSGGLDSTVTATLAVEALGPTSVKGLVLPADGSDESNVCDAQGVAFALGIDFRTVDVQPVVDSLVETMSHDYWLQGVFPSPLGLSPRPRGADGDEDYRKAVGNATARARMMAVYFEANLHDRLVVGTGNRTERLLGYVTKYGDGGVDCLPLGGLYKTEVRRLARHLDVPDRIVGKEPTAGLWAGQTDAGELGASYETIDAILRKLIDEQCSIERTAAVLDIEEELVAEFSEMYRDAAHKRRTPPTPETYFS